MSAGRWYDRIECPVLPGTIDGLLTRCSPVIVAPGEYAIVQGIGIDHDGVLVQTRGGEKWLAPADVVLDLSEHTSRAHAVWWLDDQANKVVEAAVREHAGTSDAPGFLAACLKVQEPTPAFVDALRRVVLAVAGLPVEA